MRSELGGVNEFYDLDMRMEVDLHVLQPTALTIIPENTGIEEETVPM